MNFKNMHDNIDFLLVLSAVALAINVFFGINIFLPVPISLLKVIAVGVAIAAVSRAMTLFKK